MRESTEAEGVETKKDIFHTEKKYKIIYADPPWEYKQTGSRGVAKQHYHTMSTQDIMKLPIRNIAADDAVLFMWATFPNISEAISVIDAWGFTYKTAAFVWVKQNRKSESLFWGMGAYTRANAEVCLIAVSDKTKAKKQILRHDIHQIILSPVEQHSKKPDVVRDKIVDLLGDVDRIELFARQHACGWDCWGDEAPELEDGLHERDDLGTMKK